MKTFASRQLAFAARQAEPAKGGLESVNVMKLARQ
jgi:hypothetical protein